MTFQSRQYLFGVTEEGEKEFLHTTLNVPEAVAFIQKHRKLFDRYTAYFYKTMSEGVEYYVD